MAAPRRVQLFKDQRFTGTVTEWNGTQGSIVPTTPPTHMEASKRGGKLILKVEDLVGMKFINKGLKVSFGLYSDGSGLGALEVKMSNMNEVENEKRKKGGAPQPANKPATTPPQNNAAKVGGKGPSGQPPKVGTLKPTPKMRAFIPKPDGSKIPQAKGASKGTVAPVQNKFQKPQGNVTPVQNKFQKPQPGQGKGSGTPVQNKIQKPQPGQGKVNGAPAPNKFQKPQPGQAKGWGKTLQALQNTFLQKTLLKSTQELQKRLGQPVPQKPAAPVNQGINKDKGAQQVLKPHQPANKGPQQTPKFGNNQAKGASKGSVLPVKNKFDKGKFVKPNSQPQAPKAPPPRSLQEKPLPPNWEQHWSDQFDVPYYWNRITKASLWVRPTK